MTKILVRALARIFAVKETTFQVTIETIGLALG